MLEPGGLRVVAFRSPMGAALSSDSDLHSSVGVKCYQSIKDEIKLYAISIPIASQCCSN